MKVKLKLARSTHNKGDASLDRFLREIVVDPVSVHMLTGRELKRKEKKEERKVLDRRKERGDSVK